MNFEIDASQQKNILMYVAIALRFRSIIHRPRMKF